MNIPNWDEVDDKRAEGKALSALERFVLDNEPAGKDAERAFRQQLRAMLDEVVANAV